MLYIDIETTPAFKSFDDADEKIQELFTKKMRMEIASWDYELTPDQRLERLAGLYKEKAGLFAEFNKIVCVSIGVVKQETMHIKSLIGDETTILVDLKEILDKVPYENLCAHFGKGFDYPVLCRKYVIHQIIMPTVLNIQGKKPWELQLQDSQEMWKFGDMRHSCSLDLLAHCFGLPSPKDQMDGSEVAHYYYNVPDGIQKIAEYCEKDVRTLINVHRRMEYKEPIL